MTLKIGFVGCGGMGSVHLQCLKALSSFLPLEVSAIADVRPERLKNALAIFPHSQGYSLGKDLIAKANVDLVYVCLPSYLHADHAEMALKKGRDVFVEKPVCLSLAEAKRLQKAQHDSGKEVMVGQVVRFFPEFVYLKTLLAEGKYGKLKSLDLVRASGAPIWGYENWFMDEKRSGSVVLDLHIHDLDFLRYLLGEPTLLSVSATSFESGMINRIVASYRFGQVKAVAEGMWQVATKVPFVSAYRADFEKASVTCHMFASPSLVVYPFGGEPIIPELPKEDPVKGSGVNISDLGAYYLEDRYFLNCILKHEKNVIAPLDEGIASLKVALKELALAHKN